jgi:peptidoglycan/LPS O-acetylase OafA/YrhL
LSERQHFATLDGLRGVAAIMVVTLHVLHPFDITLSPHAGLAVDFFFCLSGFVVAYAYENRLLGTMSFVEFAVARIIRLYPMILAGLLLGSAVYIVRAAALHHQSPVTPNFLLAVICEALLVPIPPILGESWPDITPFDTPAWSLFFEVFANFAYAVFVARLTKPPVMTFLLILGAVIVVAQAYVLGGVTGGGSWHDLGEGFGRVLFPFLCGVFLYRRWNARRPGAHLQLAPLVPIALLAVLLCPSPPSVRWLYESCAVVVVFPLIIGAGALDAPGPRATSIYLFLGRLSYPLYILHYPLIRLFSKFARANDLHGSGFSLLILAEILSAIGFSFVVMKFFDEPVRDWLRRKWRSRRQINARPLPS